MVDDDQIVLGKILQWRLWLVSDSISSSICIGGIMTKLANFYGLQLDNLECIPVILLNNTFVKNSKQLSFMENKWVWKGDAPQVVGEEGDVMDTIVREIEEFKGNEGVEGDPTQVIHEEGPPS